MKSSTLRSTDDRTVAVKLTDRRTPGPRTLISSEWDEFGKPDLVNTLRLHPEVLRDRSLLLNLAIEEFRCSPRSPDFDLERFCARFEEFGSSIQRSIFRQLQVECFIDGHPELLEALSAPNWPKAGEKFGSFYVLEEMGVGATARVYLCLEADVGNRKVVVKATPYSSFEASILGRLSHPGIVPIYSAGVVEELGLNYLCMPYCGRSTLTDVLNEAFQYGCPRGDEAVSVAARLWTDGKNTVKIGRHARFFAPIRRRTYVDRVLQLAIQIADALEHAHNHKILHGDLKPSNVLITSEGRPLLLDFNLSQDSTATVLPGGTLPYMPPEYLQEVACRSSSKEARTVSAASDIYSFGALLYELLTGATPVVVKSDGRDSAAVAKSMIERLRKGVVPLRSKNRLVGRRLESIVLKCLSFDVKGRPAAIKEVKQILVAELRSFAAVARLARVRPVFFSVFVVLPILAISTALVNVSLLPPRYVRLYDDGRRNMEEQNFERAVSYFSASVEANPSFVPAQYDLGQALLACGELDRAINQFRALVDRDNDCKSMVYLGYCFNLKGLPNVAILWYERAIQSGDDSLAAFNNLGASYLVAKTNLSRHECLKRAEITLSKALRRSKSSTTVQLNIVRHAVKMSLIDSTYDPRNVWRQAYAILPFAQSDRLVHSEVASWYEFELAFGSRRQAGNGVTTVEDIDHAARAAFEELRRMAKVDTSKNNEDEHLTGNYLADTSRQLRCYLKPSWP